MDKLQFLVLIVVEAGEPCGPPCYNCDRDIGPKTDTVEATEQVEKTEKCIRI